MHAGVCIDMRLGKTDTVNPTRLLVTAASASHRHRFHDGAHQAERFVTNSADPSWGKRKFVGTPTVRNRIAHPRNHCHLAPIRLSGREASEVRWKGAASLRCRSLEARHHV